MTEDNIEETLSDLTSNPLLEGYGPPVPFAKFTKLLVAKPLATVDWRSKPPVEREEFLNNPSAHFVPVRTAMEPAAGLQTLVRRALDLINPLLPENRRRVNLISTCSAPNDLLSIGSVDGAGALWDGISGTGRSMLASRVLKVIVPDQVRAYGPSQACGWTKMLQAVWIVVDHPSNGTRTGILKRVLAAIDSVLGTSYFDDNKRITSVDTLLVIVCSKLALHRVTLLVIDENHEDNLANSPWHHEFVLFYQSTMNLGVSILLIGNPLAFTNLMSYGQPLRRLMVGGIHHFQPAASVATPWWAEDFVPRMREFKVVEECDIPDERRSQLEFEYTGGVTGLYPLLHVQAQRIALRRGGRTAVLIEKDLHAAAKSPFFEKVRAISNCVRGIDDGQSMKLLDIPDSAIASRAKPSADGAKSNSDAALQNISGAGAEFVKRMVTRFKQQQTRAATKFVKRLEVIARLTEDERRMLGLSDELEAAALAHKEALDAKKTEEASDKEDRQAKKAAAKSAEKKTPRNKSPKAVKEPQE